MRKLLAFLVFFSALTAFSAQFTLNWSDNSTNESGFRIERKLEPSGAWIEIAVTAANVQSYVDSGLSNATTYSYRLCAFNSAGNSGYSNTATGTTPTLGELPNGIPGVLPLVLPGRLGNISTRGVVAVGTDPLIGGFVIYDGPATVLLRGVGPGLTKHGVLGVMADPQITIYRGSTQISTHDNWSGQAVADAAAKVGAFPLDVGSKDAAVLVTLQPGVYTVHVTGVNGSTGNTLFEVYDTNVP